MVHGGKMYRQEDLFLKAIDYLQQFKEAQQNVLGK